MIEIYVDLERLVCYIYSIEDWETLRCKYRIVGEMSTSSPCLPSLPLKLLTEEALTLKRKGFARFVTYPKLNFIPTANELEAFTKFREDLVAELKEVYKQIRKNELEKLIDKIVCGKRKKGDTRPKEDILEEELNKTCKLDDDKILWPIYCHQLYPTESIEVPEDVILKRTTSEKLAIFTDLWDKGYYITHGSKFGGDLLLYLGDPILYHAVDIVHYISNNRSLHPSELVAFSRLANSVKKRTVLASLKDNGIVSYITINWLDK